MGATAFPRAILDATDRLDRISSDFPLRMEKKVEVALMEKVAMMEKVSEFMFYLRDAVAF